MFFDISYVCRLVLLFRLQNGTQETNCFMSLNDTIASEALAAAAGGAISSGVLYPLEVLKTRMQADDATVDDSDIDGDGDGNDDDTGKDKTGSSKVASASSIEYARTLYRSEGISVFLDGMEVSAFQSAIEKACYFFAYTALKRSYAHLTTSRTKHNISGSTKQRRQISAVSSVLLGCLAEWAHLPITLPIDALTTAIQTSGGSKKKTTTATTVMNSTPEEIDDPKTRTVLALWMTLWKEKSFYKGIQAYWILCFKPALQYTIFEQIKAWLLRLRRITGETRSRQPSTAAQLSAGEAFLLGMFSRAVATLVVFPFVRAKVRMQSLASTSKSSAVGSVSQPTIWKLLSENYTNGGLNALYQGLGPELTRGVLSAALMMMVKERISGGVKLLLHGRRS